MKVFAIPTVTAGVTASLSVLFFTGVSQVFGDTLLAGIILTQASVALVQLAMVPQGWVYVIGSPDPETLKKRYSQAMTLELAGIALALTLILVALQLPWFARLEAGVGAVPLFFSLVIQGSTSCMGRLRATENWLGYCLWNLTGNAIRAPLIWATPALVSAGLLPAAMDRATIIIIFFLLPDIVRFLIIYVPQAIRHYRWPGIDQSLQGARIILTNWSYDLASALTEVFDKILVGALLGPSILVAYFFARKIGIISIMVLEPFYAEFYRRCATIADDVAARRAQMQVYVRGLGLGTVLFFAMALAIGVVGLVPALRNLLPASVSQHLDLFLLILAADCAISANRWSRYIAQLRGGVSRLFTVRILLFGVFVAGVTLCGSAFGGLGVGLALATVPLLEALYIAAWLRYGPADCAITGGKR
ncbi:MAG: hypothetical protein DCF31_14155 [Alphaproteobacteria bacterium]|nr:MAG: hypothetical protein DCF31_14155 [Alphaproteobacteria bacterium]